MIKLLFLLTFISCGDVIEDMVYKDTPAPPPKTSDAELIPYVNKFADLYDIPINVPINFKELDFGRAGVCYLYPSGYAEIEIDPTHWANSTREQREQLVFHELGHCVFELPHDNTTLSNHCPNSIMRSFMFNIQEIYNCYLPLYNHYITELDK